MNPLLDEPAQQRNSSSTSPRLRLTVGAGKTDNKGGVVALDSEHPVMDLRDLLTGPRATGVEAWSVGGVFVENLRKEANWIEGSIAFVDVDAYGADGTKKEMTAAEAKGLFEQIGLGNLGNATPHGLRITFAYTHPVADADLHRRALRGAAGTVADWISDLALTATPGTIRSKDGKTDKPTWFNGLHLDPVSWAHAQLFYTPRATVDGLERNAEVLVLREEPYAPEELAALAPADDAVRHPVDGISIDIPAAAPAAGPAPAPADALVSDAEFKAAAAKYAQDHPRQWPASNAPCPRCGGSSCFGQDPTDPARWTCFSTKHDLLNPPVGVRGDRCWVGDALDIDAAVVGISLVDFLVREGYLDPAWSFEDISGAPSESLRTIEVRPGPSTTDEAAKALLADPNAQLFHRGGVLVTVTPDLASQPGAAPLHEVNSSLLNEKLSRAARFLREVAPPKEVVRALLDNPGLRLPRIDAVATCPALLPSGEIIETPGYHEPSKTFLAGEFTDWPKVPQAPSSEDARAALEALRDLYVDFPFHEPCDESAAIAEVLTVVCRQAIEGPVPMFSHRATVQASGKTLLAQVTCLIAEGRDAAMSAWPNNEEEQQKQIHAIALEGHRTHVLDNLTGTFFSKALASVLTGGRWRGRNLGHTQLADSALTTVFISTGNGLQFESDFSRRVIPIDLEPEEEVPSERTGFKHADILGYVRENRPALVVAALTIVREHILAGGRLPPGLPEFGGYRKWSDLIRGALVRLGMADPYLGNQRLRERADPERDRLAALYQSWYAAFSASAVKVGELLAAAELGGDLKSALSALNFKNDNFLPSGAQLGKAFRSYEGRKVGGLVLRRSGTYQGQWLWKVEPCAPPPPGMPQATAPQVTADPAPVPPEGPPAESPRGGDGGVGGGLFQDGADW
jgi:hypothetical protein